MGKAYMRMRNLFSTVLIPVCALSAAWGQENSPQRLHNGAKSDFIEEQQVDPFYLVADWSLLDDLAAESQHDLSESTVSCSDLLYRNQVP